MGSKKDGNGDIIQRGLQEKGLKKIRHIVRRIPLSLHTLIAWYKLIIMFNMNTVISYRYQLLRIRFHYHICRFLRETRQGHAKEKKKKMKTSKKTVGDGKRGKEEG